MATNVSLLLSNAKRLAIYLSSTSLRTAKQPHSGVIACARACPTFITGFCHALPFVMNGFATVLLWQL